MYVAQPYDDVRGRPTYRNSYQRSSHPHVVCARGSDEPLRHRDGRRVEADCGELRQTQHASFGALLRVADYPEVLPRLAEETRRLVADRS